MVWLPSKEMKIKDRDMEKYGARRIEKDSPEFEEIAKQITHIDKVPKTRRQSSTLITADRTPIPKARRLESTEKLR